MCARSRCCLGHVSELLRRSTGVKVLRKSNSRHIVGAELGGVLRHVREGASPAVAWEELVRDEFAPQVKERILEASDLLGMKVLANNVLDADGFEDVAGYQGSVGEGFFPVVFDDRRDGRVVVSSQA